MLHEHIILYLPWLPDFATGQASHAQRNKHVLCLVTRHLLECVSQQPLQPSESGCLNR